MPIILYSGTYRFLDPSDFPSQPYHGIVLELAGSTVPLVLFQIIYIAQAGELPYLSFLGLTVHMLQLLLAIRHWIAARHDPDRRFIMLHPGTCVELKDKWAHAAEVQETMPSEPDVDATAGYDLYLSTRKPRRQHRAPDVETDNQVD